MRFASADNPVVFHTTDTFREDDNRSTCIRISLITVLTGLLILVLVDDWCWAARPASMKVSGGNKIRLFGSVEFRSSLTVLPKWIRVMKSTKQQISYFSTCKGKACSPAAGSWKHIIRQARGKSSMEQLKMVNRFFNQWPYRLDVEVYGVTDYWADPGEFMKLSGDCEDYSIVKYYALRELGFDARSLRIVVLKDEIRNISHAVVAVYMDKTAYILDNLSDLVMDHNKYTHYTPQYSVNETNRWAHVMPPIGDF